jgi:hypothetical protein
MAFQDGEILEHVFDLSYNQLTGELPAFLNDNRVPSYARRIYLTVVPQHQLVAAT